MINTRERLSPLFLHGLPDRVCRHNRIKHLDFSAPLVFSTFQDALFLPCWVSIGRIVPNNHKGDENG
jgi:hypothetical protein